MLLPLLVKVDGSLGSELDKVTSPLQTDDPLVAKSLFFHIFINKLIFVEWRHHEHDDKRNDGQDEIHVEPGQVDLSISDEVSDQLLDVRCSVHK